MSLFSIKKELEEAREEVERLRGQLKETREELMILRDEQVEISKIEKLFKLVTDNVGDLLAVVDSDGNRVWNNKAYSTTLGYEIEDLEGTHSLVEVHPEDRPMVEKVFEESLLTGVGNKIEYRIKHGGGHYLTLESQARVVTNEDGTVENLVLLSRDISQRKSSEEELIKARQNVAVVDMATGVAHEFDSILNNLVQHIKEAHEVSVEVPEIQEHLVSAEKASMQAQRIVNRLLGLRGGFSEDELKICHPELLLSKIDEEINTRNKAIIELQFSHGIPNIRVHIDSFSEAITNVVNNSLDVYEGYEEKQIVKIECRVVNFVLQSVSRPPQLSPGTYVCIEIEDKGPGMSPDVLEQAFNPYFTTKEGASGLGLTSALSILSQHRGTIIIKSKPETGTNVLIYVPAYEEKGPYVEKPVGEEVSSKRVLFMDDEELLRKFISRMLGQLGFETTAVKDGDEAISIYQEEMDKGAPFDVVILDLVVPNGKSGTDAVHELRQIDPNVKAIASSGYIEDPSMMDPAPSGFDGVIAKPYNKERLRHVLNNLLQIDEDIPWEPDADAEKPDSGGEEDKSGEDK